MKMTYYEKYMQRCIQLAYNGLGTTYPNPMVGSVLVFEDNIIGEGWHQKAGKPHAEVNAILSVKNKELLSKSTIFVSLEPCSHFGKTPPCADVIIKHKIPKVVIGTIDPFTKVCGNGIKKLQEAGCEVTVGVLEKECQELNKRFFTFHQKKRPYVFLKWAETSNGFIAPKQKEEIKPFWITNSFSKQYTHKIRSEEQAILVGTNTVLHDNPKLDTRHWQGSNPLRVIIDRELKTSKHFSVWDDSTNTIFITEKTTNTPYKNTFFENIIFSENIAHQICNVLYQKGTQSLIVEGGRTILQQFINTNLWDEAFVFTGKSTFEAGVQAPTLKNASLQKTMLFGDNHLFIYKNSQQ